MKKGPRSFRGLPAVAVFSIVLNAVLIVSLLIDENVQLSSDQSNNIGNRATSANTFGPEFNTATQVESEERISNNDNARNGNPSAFTVSSLSDEKFQEYLESGNYAALASILNQLGLPPALVRNFIFSIMSTRESVAQVGYSKEYWRAQSVSPSVSTSVTLKSNELMRRQLIQLFGEDVRNDPQFFSLFRPYQQTLSFLSSEKQIKLQELQLASITGSQPYSPEEYTRQIEAILGPDDYHEYQLRESPLAKSLQRELAAFDYSEQDYREIYRIKMEAAQSTYGADGMLIQTAALSGADFGLNGLTIPENAQEEQSILAYLGEARYSEYKMSKRPAFRKVLNITGAQGNKREDSMAAFQVLNQAKSQMTALHQDASLDPDSRQDRLDSVLDDANKQLKNIVGEPTADILVSEILTGPKLYKY